MSEALPPLAAACKSEEMEFGSITLFQAMQLGEFWYHSDEEDASEPSVTEGSRGGCGDEEPAGSTSQAPFPLMDLPFELRLQVYKWVHLSQPIVPGRITPWYPTPIYNPYVSRRVRAPAAAEDGTSRDTPAGKPRQPEPGLLSAFRPCGGIPTAVLRANRQLYYEIREIPLVVNEFEFVNWFASGLWAARSFTRPLQPWQQDAMRYVRLDMLAKDLSGAYAAEWLELCRLWAKGLHGLRLRIAGCGPFGAWVTDGLPQGQGSGTGTAEGTKAAEDAGDGSGGVGGSGSRGAAMPRQWLEAGLTRLTALRRLEIDLAMPAWDNEGKLAWCRDLQEALNAGRAAAQPRVRVTCVEKC